MTGTVRYIPSVRPMVRALGHMKMTSRLSIIDRYIDSVQEEGVSANQETDQLMRLLEGRVPLGQRHTAQNLWARLEETRALLWRSFPLGARVAIELEEAWLYPSRPVCDYRGLKQFWSTRMHYQDMPRMCGVLEALIGAQESRGVRRHQLTVGVAGHGEDDRFILEYLVDQGLRVVSREQEVIQKIVVSKSHSLIGALDTGQFVLSPIEQPHPSRPYNILLWPHPDPDDDLKLDQAIADGGYVLVQTDHPMYSGRDALEESEAYRLLYSRDDLNQQNYVFYSAHLTREYPTYLSLWQRHA